MFLRWLVDACIPSERRTRIGRSQRDFVFLVCIVDPLVTTISVKDVVCVLAKAFVGSNGHRASVGSGGFLGKYLESMSLRIRLKVPRKEYTYAQPSADRKMYLYNACLHHWFEKVMVLLKKKTSKK